MQYVIKAAILSVMRNYIGIKPQDVLIMLKLLIHPGMAQKELGDSLSISQAEVSHALKRLKFSRLLREDGQLFMASCAEFLIHGFKYVCPAVVGQLAMGIPTAYAHPDFNYVVYDPKDIYVWPYAQGKSRGSVIEPFYPTLPEACLKDPELYRIASLIEMIRVGRARERNAATKEIEKMFSKSA